MRAISSVLVYRPGQLGDTLVSLPALEELRKRHGRARLTLLTDSHPGRGLVSSWEILSRTGIFSRVMFYRPASVWRGLLGLIWKIRRLRPELLYYLPPIPRTRVQMLRDRVFFRALCGIKESRGLAETSAWGERDARGPVRLPSEAVRLMRIAGGAGPRRLSDVPARDAERSAVDLFWRESGIPRDALVIALGPGSNISAKRWPQERYAALARRLLSALPDAHLLIMGGPLDGELARDISSAAGGRARVAAGRLSVLQSAEALRRCALYVGNDSGVMHLAAAVGTRCVAIFSSRDHPGLWEPLGEGHAVLRKQVPCAGCFLSVCKEKALRCLTEISVDEVLSACLAASPSRSPAA